LKYLKFERKQNVSESLKDFFNSTVRSWPGMGEMAEQRQKSDMIHQDNIQDLGIIDLIQNE
jgi:hypothetical protein